MTQFEVSTLEEALYIINRLDSLTVGYDDELELRVTKIRNRIQHVLMRDSNKKIRKVLTDRIAKKV
jgi:hypothetical protein